MNGLPIIRLEVERMQHSVSMVLSDYAAQMDKDVQAAVKEFCSKDKMKDLIRSEAQRAINEAVKEEIRDMFKYSNPGRRAIREAVQKFMDKQWADLP